MAAQGWQDGYPNLQPPPAPPRRRSPVDASIISSSGTHPTAAQPPIPKQRTTVKFKSAEGVEGAGGGNTSGSEVSSSRSRPELLKTSSLFTGDSAVSEYGIDDLPRPHSVHVPSSSGFMADLQGIDFSSSLQRNMFGTSGSLSSQNHLSSSLEDLVSKPMESGYPDISSAFRELRSEMVTPNMMVAPPNYAPPGKIFPSYNSSSGGIGYGWNPCLLDPQANTPFIVPNNLMTPSGSSTGSTAGGVSPGLSSFQGNGSYSGQGYPGNLSSQPSTNVLGQPALGGPFHGGILGGQMNENSPSYTLFPQMQSGLTRAASWTNIHDYSKPSKNDIGISIEDSVLPQPQCQEETEEAGSNVDLINLQQGFPEHEYLSLDFFDPLYERGRKQSIEVQNQNGALNYSMGEAFSGFYQEKGPDPALRRHQRRLSHEIWGVSTSQQLENRPQKKHESIGNYECAIGFETLALEMFGTSDEEFLQSKNVLTTSNIEPTNWQPHSRPDRPPAHMRTSEQVSIHKLQRKCCSLTVMTPTPTHSLRQFKKLQEQKLKPKIFCLAEDV